jgi:hypothetical protein
MALARAARDVIDRAQMLDRETEAAVPVADIEALRDAVEPIYPGPAT